ncbi:hypothetical protein E8D34_11365 [Nocardioides sp. GY 10113]|uniref:hypothetical protein n=1 Tax=Nocardioides sp. GY 10113 TaxID=2569761 RepID=UPI0010A766C6|nr:hypothetical protein [Nocardioides sp. GY 10113]TIC86272.1 hypothetical protein E8D34_11365 [Nocardioides sp. GY 10113]
MSSDETTTAPDAERSPEGARRGYHPVNVGHLVMGVAFLGLTVVWALLASGAAEPDDARWLLPTPWLVAGAVGLVATLFRGRSRQTP